MTRLQRLARQLGVMLIVSLTATGPPVSAQSSARPPDISDLKPAAAKLERLHSLLVSWRGHLIFQHYAHGARAKDEAAATGQSVESAKPDSKAQYNFTDPESRIMKGPDGFVQAYNVQVAVDELQLIVGQAVTHETNDKQQLIPMIATIKEQSGDTLAQLLADAGYCSDENLKAVAKTKIDAYISTRKQTHGERPGPCPRGPLPKTATRVDRMSRKLYTKAGAAVYAARKAIVEPVIGQIKQARGFRQFLLRGLEQVQGEWSLVCTTHNILKLYRLCG